MGPSQLEKLFNPEAIAVFGASESGRSVGSRVFSNLRRAGFKGALYPINPKHERVGDLPCFAAIADAPGPVDLAVIATPADTVAGIIRECGEAGIGHAIVLTAGFREMGEEGMAREAELIETATRYGVRFVGPNCVGLVRPAIGMDASFLNAATPKGRLALVSQSGALCSAISDWAEPHHLGFSALVSLGNSGDIGFGDILNFLAHDRETNAILLYVEGVRDARSFLSALRLAARLKPVIVLKAGRNTDSAGAAHTHTGALMGSDDVFDAALARVGAVRAQTFGQLFAAAEVLSAGIHAGGDRLAIITNGGGAGVLAADRAGDLGVKLPNPAPDTIAALDAVLPAYWSKANPVDILGDASPEKYKAATEACLKDDTYDGVLVMLTPQAMTVAADAAKAVIEVAGRRPPKPVLACWMGESSVREARHTLSAAGIPDFTTPERAIEAFSYLAWHEQNRRLALELPGSQSHAGAQDVDGARMIIDAVLAEGRDMLSDIEAKGILRAFGIPVNVTIEADTAAKALVEAETLGFPVAVKINSPDISHKSDVGGVRTNVLSAADLRVAYNEVIAAAKAAQPDAAIKGVTVEATSRIQDARELVIGASRDPVFGPAILFGAGGTMVEVLRDSAVTLPPLNEVLARRLIKRTRVSRLLEAFRDRAPVDHDAVVDVLMRVSDLVCDLPEVVELDINPLFAGPGGVIAVDARIKVKRLAPGVRRHDHMAIAPYPRHLVRKGFLTDGTPVTIRPIRPSDAESERAFVRDLSPEAKRFRFLSALRELSPKMLAEFTQIDYSREMALIALTEENGAPVQHGVVRYAINADGESCEFAIVVSDRIQKKGLGTLLMNALMDTAREYGLKSMEGTVLAENAGMLQLMRELGFSIRPSTYEMAVMEVERQL